MDLLFLASVLAAVFVVGDAINCHDCTSWNPYCREHVQVPFPDAVASVECKQTKTCFTKRDKQGVISRGCGDWLEEGELDASYEGCKVQESEWSGKEVWCFCKSDHCNAGPVDEMGEHVDVYPKPGDYEGEDNTAGAPAVDKSQDQFDDFSSNYFLQQERHLADPAWQMWFWHAESDRPRWTPPGQHTVASITQQPEVAHDAAPTGAPKSHSQNPWERLFPWWYGRINWERMADAEPPRPTSTPLAEQWWGQKAQNEVKEEGSDSEPKAEDKQKSPFDPSSPDLTPEVDPLPGQDINKPDFYCWDCFSDSPLCRERVDTQRAMYLGKTSCPRTNKCFVRKDKDVIYRGCADGWMGSVINTDYVGCRKQQMWNGEVEWCFCTASLCNSDSLEDIQAKYVSSLSPQPFRKLPASQNLTRVTAPVTSPMPTTVKKTATTTTTTPATPTTTRQVTKATAAASKLPAATFASGEATPVTTAPLSSKVDASGKTPLTSAAAAANGKASGFQALVGR